MKYWEKEEEAIDLLTLIADMAEDEEEYYGDPTAMDPQSI